MPPEVDGTSKRPDFLVSSDDCSFYLEAKVLGQNQVDAKRDRIRNGIYDELNSRVQSQDFFIRVEFDRESEQPIPIRRLAEAAQEWLDGLDVEDVRSEVEAGGPLGATPFVWEDQRSGWAVALVPMPKSQSKDSDRIVSLMGGDARWIDDRTPIRKALDAKAHRYGDELDRPFVVALGLARPFADDTDLADALFGDEVYAFDPVSGDGELRRQPNGLWIGPNGPRTRRLSGVLVSYRIAPWLSGKTDLTLWKNPWADYPLDCGAGAAVRILNPTDDGSLHASPAVMTTGELLGLADSWPGPEPAFERP